MAFVSYKEGWLEKAPWSYTPEAMVLARVTLTLIAAHVAEIAKTAQGRGLTGQGIRRLRRELNREVGLAPVTVFAAGAYGMKKLRWLWVDPLCIPFSVMPSPQLVAVSLDPYLKMSEHLCE